MPPETAETALWNLAMDPQRVCEGAPEASANGVALALGLLRAELDRGCDAESAIESVARGLQGIDPGNRTSVFLALLVVCGELRSTSGLPFSATLLEHLENAGTEIPDVAA